MGFSPCSYLEHILFIRSVPGFPTSPLSPVPLMWFSLKRTTCSWPKPQISTGNLGEPRDLQFRGPLLETRNPMLKQNCHLACPGVPWDRTRISCHAALDKTACAPFLKERRMMFANATNIHRKSGGAQWRDLRFSLSSHADSKALMSPRADWFGCSSRALRSSD